MDSVSNVRAEMVARLKEQVRDKTYRIKADEIADKITQKLREEEAQPGQTTGRKWTA